jgi:hypothetical protein
VFVDSEEYHSTLGRLKLIHYESAVRVLSGWIIRSQICAIYSGYCGLVLYILDRFKRRWWGIDADHGERSSGYRNNAVISTPNT